jgi:simple sugar transport system substrate-binding protein
MNTTNKTGRRSGLATIGRALALVGAFGFAVSIAQPVAYAADQGQKTLAVAVKVAGDPWWKRMDVGLTKYASEHPELKVFMQGVSEADAALQAQLINDLIAQKVDALGIDPISPETLKPVIAKAKAAGIKVVTTEGALPMGQDLDVEAFDNAAYGVHLMDALAKRMGGEGEYAVFVGELTNVSHNQWVDAAIAHQKKVYPKMKLVGTRNETNEDAATAYRETQQLLTAYPDIKGFEGSGSNDVVGIGEALEDAGLQDKPVVVGTSHVSLTHDLLGSGAVDMISFWDPALAGEAVAESANRLLQGKTVNTGDDLGLAGYDKVTVKDGIVYGQAWIDVTKDNMGNYNF